MELAWRISDKDVTGVQAVVAQYENTPLVRYRVKVNLAEQKTLITRDRFWRALAGSLLTTQQKSGPTSAVSRFIKVTPYPIPYKTCRNEPRLESFLRKTISQFGGIRFSTKISAELASNLAKLEAGEWSETLRRVNILTVPATSETERDVAEYLDKSLKGLGPKQSRNLLQGLGLTRFEIPIDSRITKWLNQSGFPVHLSAAALGDRHYYRFVSEGVQRLCKAADVAPCIFDAAVFASFDKTAWSEDIAGW